MGQLDGSGLMGAYPNFGATKGDPPEGKKSPNKPKKPFCDWSPKIYRLQQEVTLGTRRGVCLSQRLPERITKKKAYHPPTLQGGWKAFFGGGHIGVSAWVYHLPPFKAGLARARAPKSFLRNLPPTAHFRLSGIFGGDVRCLGARLPNHCQPPHNSEPIRHHGWGVWTPCAKISTDIQLFWRILVQLAKTVYLLKCCMDKNKAAKKLAKNIYIYI